LLQEGHYGQLFMSLAEKQKAKAIRNHVFGKYGVYSRGDFLNATILQPDIYACESSSSFPGLVVA
jgi:hypothetical protein